MGKPRGGHATATTDVRKKIAACVKNVLAACWDLRQVWVTTVSTVNTYTFIVPTGK
ncbi:hypothetical protein MGSAQ_002082 [marine sediment metagenome]|uniref:Uncharacterized protein n=1 Tax=marine sediment metagenome TaxID=412755 RepID=A0A1B6NU17_9ZZZZ